ncbi:DoxX family protein [Deminuibacter soli]|uniref:DoxX family protein n=1 Tax=Deminuibacter soli TaxID=2291815 RepID=A0A3E1NI75_9BACT|nr:DoxX family protein [Deminuibacter soli]RFM27571.1 DoxX family protein [Deminuibacter soli]
MRKFLSTNYSDGAFNFAMLLLRLSFGALLIVNHGIPHLMHFGYYAHNFYNLLGIGSRNSLLLVIFAEVFCSIFVVLGLFTRLTVIPPLIVMLVALFMVHAHQPFEKSELAVLYGTAFMAILFCGPGKISIDGMTRG